MTLSLGATGPTRATVKNRSSGRAHDQYRRASWHGSRAASVASATFGAVTAHPAEPVPDADPDEAAVAAAALQEYREWVAKGRPGSVSHEEAMAELLGDAQ